MDIPLIFAENKRSVKNVKNVAENKRSVKNVKNDIDVWADFGVK